LSSGKAKVDVQIVFAGPGRGQRAIGESGTVVLRCRSSRRQNGRIDQIALKPPGAASRARGTAIISRHRGRWQMSIRAQHVAPNGQRDAYAVWLYSAPEDNHLLGFVNPGVGRDGQIQATSLLPTDVGCYEEIVISREMTATPKHPHHVVLAGTIEIR
jgi:hypothetical protein